MILINLLQILKAQISTGYEPTTRCLRSTVPFAPLTGQNYPTWKIQCKMPLVRDGLWELIDGSETLTDNANAETTSKFNKRDRAMAAVIVLSIVPSLL